MWRSRFSARYPHIATPVGDAVLRRVCCMYLSLCGLACAGRICTLYVFCRLPGSGGSIGWQQPAGQSAVAGCRLARLAGMALLAASTGNILAGKACICWAERGVLGCVRSALGVLVGSGADKLLALSLSVCAYIGLRAPVSLVVAAATACTGPDAWLVSRGLFPSALHVVVDSAASGVVQLV